MNKVNFDSFSSIHASEALIQKALAIPESMAKAPHRLSLRKWMIAAAVVLLTVGSFVLYGIFVAPSAAVYLESRESVSIILNSRGRVLSATQHPELSGQSAEAAVAAVTKSMLNSGALDAEENTLIIGTAKLSETRRDTLTQAVQQVFSECRFHGAIVSLNCSDTGAKAAAIDLLEQLDKSLTHNSLLKCSIHELNLLLHRYLPKGVQLLGEPSEGTVYRRSPHSGKTERPLPTEQPQTSDPVETKGDPLPLSGSRYLPRTATNPPATEAAANRSQIPVQEDSPTSAPTSAPTRESAVPAQKPSSPPTESPTVSVETATESPQEKSLTVLIPYDKLNALSGTVPQDIDGTNAPGIHIESYRDPLAYSTSFPSDYAAEIPISGRQDSILLLIRTYEVFVSLVNTDPDSGELGAFGARLQTDYAINADFFRENALIVLYYTYDKAYVNAYESDGIGTVKVNGDTAYVWFNQTLIEQAGYVTSAVPYIFKTAAAAEVKKSDVADVSNLVLIPEVTVEAEEYPRKQDMKQRSE